MLFANILNHLFPKPYIDETTRKRLLDKFGTSGYWYPVHDESKPDNMQYFEIDTFKKYIGDKKLIELIKGLGENEVNAIYEIGDDTTINVEEIVICNDETIYCNTNVDWVIYCSHENTLSFGGKILLDALKQEWIDWEKYADSREKNDW